MRPLADELSDERRGAERIHLLALAAIQDMDDEPLLQAEHDLFEYLAFGPARYPQANWRMTAAVFATVVEERAFRDALQ